MSLLSTFQQSPTATVPRSCLHPEQRILRYFCPCEQREERHGFVCVLGCKERCVPRSMQAAFLSNSEHLSSSPSSDSAGKAAANPQSTQLLWAPIPSGTRKPLGRVNTTISCCGVPTLRAGQQLRSHQSGSRQCLLTFTWAWSHWSWKAIQPEGSAPAPRAPFRNSSEMQSQPRHRGTSRDATAKQRDLLQEGNSGLRTGGETLR